MPDERRFPMTNSRTSQSRFLWRKARGSSFAKFVVIAAVLVLGAMFLQYASKGGNAGGSPTAGSGGSGGLPVGFQHSSLKVAMDEAAGGPVLAFVTADWCGPCQSFKNGALSDPRFAQWIAQNGVKTAYIDSTNGNPEATQASVRAYPTLLYYRNGRETGRRVGGMPIDRLITWMEQANKG